jgi:hypothetical protein
MKRLAAILAAAALAMAGTASAQQAPRSALPDSAQTLNAPEGAPPGVTYNPMPFAVGQVWTLKDAPEGARFTVMRIEILPTDPPMRAVHGSLSGFPPIVVGGEQIDINGGHMPLIDKALMRSVDRIESTGAEVTPAFTKGYLEWRRVHGGVFAVTVTEAYAAVSDMLHDRTPPPEKLTPDRT